MVFNATFNNILVISWRSVLLVKQTRENHRPSTSHWQTLSYKKLYRCCQSFLVFVSCKQQSAFIFLTYLPKSQMLKKNSIYSNKFCHNFHMSESQFYLSRASDKWVSAKTETVVHLRPPRVSIHLPSSLPLAMLNLF